MKRRVLQKPRTRRVSNHAVFEQKCKKQPLARSIGGTVTRLDAKGILLSY